MTPYDRTVHGLTAQGHAIVRYDRAGKWFIEGGRLVPAERITVTRAAIEAARGTHFPGRPGGTRFDALVRKEPAQ